MYRGDYHFNKKDAKIVYLGLKIEDGKGIYKEISKEEYQNYDVDLSKLDNQKLKKRYIAEINLYQMALRKEFYFLKKIIIDILHDERTTAKTYFDRQRIIKENKEEFLNKGNR